MENMILNNPRRAGKNTIVNAYMFAQKKHAGQLDDTGKDYFFAHVSSVGRILMNVTTDPAIIAAGYLHDVLEDTDTTLDEIIEHFGTKIALLVSEVTHEGNKETGYFFPRLKTRGAMLIKFADRLSNLSRMEAWDEKRQAHYMQKSIFWRSEK